ncbi:uncharacterized protein LOC142768651 [Rhipicephalus microplus]|uniref:uncharacterized protein LOC142768651 n=1 Tax=Rhipicephalus microplus TaxID=6941 RepID=UPI003F6AFF27
MKHFTVGAIPGGIVLLLYFSVGSYFSESSGHVPDGTLYRGRTYLNLIEVLNTSDPLYEYYYCQNLGISECYADGCINEMNTCEHWHKEDLTNNSYNFTNPLLNKSQIWVNMSYFAEIDTSQWPPTAMRFNDTTSNNVTYTVSVNLTYNEPDTYNCSVFSATFSTSYFTSFSTTVMYIRGSLPNGTLPSDSCVQHFLTYCHNTTIWMPYNQNCSLSREQQRNTTETPEGRVKALV